MEMICNITRNDETKLANALRSIYSSVVINESFKDQSAFLQSVILLVDDDIKYGQSLREVNPTLSYRISTTHELAAAFIRKYQNVIDKAGKLAYSANERYGYTVDIFAFFLSFNSKCLGNLFIKLYFEIVCIFQTFFTKHLRNLLSCILNKSFIK